MDFTIVYTYIKSLRYLFTKATSNYGIQANKLKNNGKCNQVPNTTTRPLPTQTFLSFAVIIVRTEATSVSHGVIKERRENAPCL